MRPHRHFIRARMSPFTRYAFSLLLALYGVYQLRADALVTGCIALGLAVLIFLFGRRR
jgi:hypothetical protein